MLTKSDLKQIGTVIDERLEKKLEQKFEEKLEPVKKDLSFLRKKVNRIDKIVNIIARKYDEEDVKLQRRVRKIEQHLDLPIPQ